MPFSPAEMGIRSSTKRSSSKSGLIEADLLVATDDLARLRSEDGLGIHPFDSQEPCVLQQTWNVAAQLQVGHVKREDVKYAPVSSLSEIIE